MKTLWKVMILVTCLVGATIAHAQCKAPPAQRSIECERCGNLQENPTRGIEQIYSEFLVNDDLRGFVALHGSARINLLRPAGASPGVTYYYGLLRDPSYVRTDTVAYGRLVSLTREHTVGAVFNAMGGEIVATLGQHLSVEVSSLWSRAVSSGTADWHIRLYDQRNRQIGEANIGRGRNATPVVDPTRGEFNTYDRYRVRECENKDPRTNEIRDGSGRYTGPPPSGPGIWPSNRIRFSGSTATCHFESYVDGRMEHLILTCGR